MFCSILVILHGIVKATKEMNYWLCLRVEMTHLKKKRARWTVRWSFHGDRGNLTQEQFSSDTMILRS